MSEGSSLVIQEMEERIVELEGELDRLRIYKEDAHERFIEVVRQRDRAEKELMECKVIIESLAERVSFQSELLGKKAEKK